MDKCLECGGKCCCDLILVHESDRLYDTEYVEVYFANLKKMKNTLENKCILLSNGRCSLYEKRPEECRVFALNSECCNNFYQGIRKKHDCKWSECKNIKAMNKKD